MPLYFFFFFFWGGEDGDGARKKITQLCKVSSSFGLSVPSFSSGRKTEMLSGLEEEGSSMAQLVRAPDFRSKGCEFESRQERRGDFSSPELLSVLTFIRRLFHLRVTAVARKKSRPFCQKCRWQVAPKYKHTHDPTESKCADYAVHA